MPILTEETSTSTTTHTTAAKAEDQPAQQSAPTQTSVSTELKPMATPTETPTQIAPTSQPAPASQTNASKVQPPASQTNAHNAEKPAESSQPAAQPTDAPTSQPTAVPVQPTQAANPPTPMCKVIHDYPLKYLTEVSTSKDGFLHVEFWVGGDAPEYETILPGGRYLLRTKFAGGHVWEYSGCSFHQVKTQVDDHINRRLAQGAYNGGYVEWESTGYFKFVR
jgi:hypothetical protein